MRRFLKESAQTVRGAQDKRTKEHFGAANRKCFVIKDRFLRFIWAWERCLFRGGIIAAEILNNRDNFDLFKCINDKT